MRHVLEYETLATAPTHRIWGATAGIIVNLARRLRW